MAFEKGARVRVLGVKGEVWVGCEGAVVHEPPPIRIEGMQPLILVEFGVGKSTQRVWWLEDQLEAAP